MGQINTSTILKQEALNLAQKNSKCRVINDAYEINKCLLISSVIDQISYDLSNVSYKVSNMTVNPLIYDPITCELLKKEDQMQMQQNIMQKCEVLKHELKSTKYKTLTTQTELKQLNEINEYSSDRKKQQRNNHSFGSNILYNIDDHGRSQTDVKPNKNFQQQQLDILFNDEKNCNTTIKQQPNSFERINIFKLEQEETENFSNDPTENSSILSISQNFTNLHNNPFPYDERQFIKNERYWTSSYSSTFMDTPKNVGPTSQTQNNFKKHQQQEQNNYDSKTLQKIQNFSVGNQHLTQQQNLGQLKNQVLQQQKQIELQQKNKQSQNQDKMNLQLQQQSQQSQQQNQHFQQTQQKYLYQQLQQQQYLQQKKEKLSQDVQLNKKLIQNQVFDSPKVEIERSPFQGYTQIHSNKKKNQQFRQLGKSPINNQSQQQKQKNLQIITQQFHKSPKQQGQQQSGSPQKFTQQPIQSKEEQQKESMRQQFDRLLKKNENQTNKPKNTKNLSDPEVNQQREYQNKKKNSPDYYQKQKQNHLKRSQSPVSPQKQQQNMFIKTNQQNQNQKFEFTNILNISPEKQIKTLEDARQNQQQQRIQNKQSHNLNLEELNYKILDIQKLNIKLDDKSNKLICQTQQDISNLQTSITQNISTSEKGLRKKEKLTNGINLDDLLDYEQNSINLDELISYRSSQEQKIQENKNKNQYF